MRPLDGDFDLNSTIKKYTRRQPIREPSPDLTNSASKNLSRTIRHRCGKLTKGDGQEKRSDDNPDDGNKPADRFQLSAPVSSVSDSKCVFFVLVQFV